MRTFYLPLNVYCLANVSVTFPIVWLFILMLMELEKVVQFFSVRGVLRTLPKIVPGVVRSVCGWVKCWLFDERVFSCLASHAQPMLGIGVHLCGSGSSAGLINLTYTGHKSRTTMQLHNAYKTWAHHLWATETSCQTETLPGPFRRSFELGKTEGEIQRFTGPWRSALSRDGSTPVCSYNPVA